MPLPNLAAAILPWFDRHGRKDLPWQCADPYRIWIAEVMLQQTRVAAVIPYYQKFIARFPDIAALANCDGDQLLHLWSGLGYYARARNLHKAAKVIMTKHGGEFPREFDEALALPGIGRSTAGAILAAAFAQRHAILDGNVKRVLSRVFAVAGSPAEVQSQLWRLAEKCTPDARVADYNQAMMDLGATLCTRARPKCDACPLKTHCKAFAQGAQDAYPTRKRKPPRPQKTASILLVRNRRGQVFLQRRPPAGIWGGLWSPPQYEHSRRAPSADEVREWFAEEYGLGIDVGDALPPVKHSFTHFDLFMRPVLAELTAAAAVRDGEWMWFDAGSPAEIGLPAGVVKVLGLLTPP